MIKSNKLTPLGIEKKKAKSNDIWVSDDDGTRGGGRLVVRISVSGSKIFYFRYSIDGKRDAIPIGPFSLQEVKGKYTLEQAREVTRTYAALHRLPASRNVKAHLEGLEKARLDAIESQEKASQDAILRASNEAKYSLEALCDAYVKHLHAQGKQSAQTVKGQIKLHIGGSVIAALPAKHVTAKHITSLLRIIIAEGKGRTAARIRSYLHAAYALAIKSELDPTASTDLEHFGIEVNPAASTASLAQFSHARDRVLTRTELGELWRRLVAYGDEAPLGIRAIRLVLLLGGQRGEQLMRVNWVESVDLESGHIIIHDGKGNRTQPRVHLLPIVGPAEDEIRTLIRRSELLGSKLLFQGAKKHLGQDAASKYIKEMSADFIEKKISKQQFQFSDLRRTAETSLASLGVHKDIRAQLQSHGLGGIQDRHYDMYEYFKEKKLAIEAWQNYLDLVAFDKPMQSNVTAIKQAA